MRIELRRGVTLHPGTFTAVIAPQVLILAALNGNPDLQRFLFLYISGNYSRILSGIDRQSKNFDVRRAFTAHQLFTMLREAGHTVVFVEHDPSLFDGAAAMLEPVSGALKEVARESLVILYTPIADRTFSALARRYRVEPAWCAKSFDLSFYRGLIDRAYAEIVGAYSQKKPSKKIPCDTFGIDTFTETG